MTVTGAAPLLCSLCLLGVRCRYDGESKPHPTATPELLRMLECGLVIPVCPEQLGGLPTPRAPAEVVGGDGYDVLDGKARVMTVQGEDVTGRFLRGAREALRIARMAGCARAVLKSGSPSCGSGESRPVIGVTAALLKRDGLRIQDEMSPLNT